MTKKYNWDAKEGQSHTQSKYNNDIATNERPCTWNLKEHKCYDHNMWT